MSTFQLHLRRAAADAVARFPATSVPEIYVVSFHVRRLGRDPRRPCLTIGWNTESRYRAELARRGPEEARWNHAHWLQDGFERFGNTPDDPVGGALFVDEAKRLGHWYEDGEDITDDEKDDCAEELCGQFATVCVDVARHLHTSGLLAGVLGRPVPVALYDPDLPGWDIEATRAANPPALAAPYLDSAP
ncbi:hypothetical protein [Streptomyces uncialis]|uniref:hypothetical protein n=1 Tax=Streptomyces uncialis TaxID=1048205 RepID=UPI0009A0CD64|nr:hypothetical protein [Streptomyces uncialis]